MQRLNLQVALLNLVPMGSPPPPVESSGRLASRVGAFLLGSPSSMLSCTGVELLTWLFPAMTRCGMGGSMRSQGGT